MYVCIGFLVPGFGTIRLNSLRFILLRISKSKKKDTAIERRLMLLLRNWFKELKEFRKE